MPELPEMQALAERLDALLSGAPFVRADVLQFSAVKTFDPPPESLSGLELAGVGRRAKYLIFDFGGPRILVHLSQGGRVTIEDPPKKTRPKTGVVRLHWRDRPALFVIEYGTQRKAGLWVLAEGDEGPLVVLGPEPSDPAFDELILAGSDGRRIHTLLRDQRTVAGIGRGYSDDILHRAQLSPYASLSSLDESKRTTLLESIHAVLDEALAQERTKTGGLEGKLGDRFTVHGRYGRPCPRCGEKLKRVSYEDYEVAYCSACQTDGKVLADRRLSRLIR